MTHEQHPIGTGFTAASTVDEVLEGIDLSGTNVVVTGGHAGLGLETTRALSRAGASVTVGARDPERAAAAVAGIERVATSWSTTQASRRPPRSCGTHAATKRSSRPTTSATSS